MAPVVEAPATPAVAAEPVSAQLRLQKVMVESPLVGWLTCRQRIKPASAMSVDQGH